MRVEATFSGSYCYGRYCDRRIAALPRDVGWQVNDQRVKRLWRREGLKVPAKEPKRWRLWLRWQAIPHCILPAGPP